MDDKTFSEKALSLAPKWHRLSYAILRSEADAEDAVQEALLRAWRSIKGLREDDYFETWFTRILINESRRILRRRAVNQSSPPPETATGPEQSEQLAGALAALDIKLRVPVLLFHMEGCKIPEIARMLSMPVPTVKWRLKKGREELKRLMKEAEL